jgi:chemotaxis signal transduction protein
MITAEIQGGLRPNAWLLDFGQDFRAAVGTRVLLQIIDNPRLHPVPYAPRYCRNVLSWQSRLLPVMDMAACLGGTELTSSLVAIAGFRERPGAPMRFGAMLLASVPDAIVVRDDQSCSLPESHPGWSNLAIACFGYQGEAVPILHLERIFSSFPDRDC